MDMKRTLSVTLALASSLLGCNLGNDGDGNGDGTGSRVDIVVLNSLGGTLGRYDLDGDQLLAVGDPIALGASFDGEAVSLLGDLFASTISSFGGSLIVIGEIDQGQTGTIPFPGPDAELVNPSKITLARTGGGSAVGLVGGRGSDAVYTVSPLATEADLFAEDVGTFVERVLPAGNSVIAIDANLDDSPGGDLQPLGNSRVVILDAFTGDVRTVIDLPAENARDGLFANNKLFVHAAGTLEDQGGQFVPQNDGAVVAINFGADAVEATFPLEANGISYQPGGDGRIYITTTSDPDFQRIDVLVFNPFSAAFVRGPDDPLRPRDADGAEVDCWAATALPDERMLCITFSFPEPGRLFLFDAEGDFLASVPTGVGATDIAVR